MQPSNFKPNTEVGHLSVADKINQGNREILLKYDRFIIILYRHNVRVDTEFLFGRKLQENPPYELSMMSEMML